MLLPSQPGTNGILRLFFYLLLFGLVGLFVYKGINTLDSMVGYRTKRYEKFGKVSARLDDIANFIPSRITALLIALLFWSRSSFNAILEYGRLHSSPNAGCPIAAMAGAVGVKLGGDTVYFGEMKKKPFFGDGKENIERDDVYKALFFQKRFEIFVILFLGFLYAV